MADTYPLFVIVDRVKNNRSEYELCRRGIGAIPTYHPMAVFRIRADAEKYVDYLNAVAPATVLGSGDNSKV